MDTFVSYVEGIFAFLSIFIKKVTFEGYLQGEPNFFRLTIDEAGPPWEGTNGVKLHKNTGYSDDGVVHVDVKSGQAISQTITGLFVGSVYTVSWAAEAHHGATTYVSVGGVEVGTDNYNGGWKGEISDPFTAKSTEAVLLIKSLGGETLIDSVSIQRVDTLE